MKFLHDATPAELADAFWQLSNVDQADFMMQIGRAIDRTNEQTGDPKLSIGTNGEMQWAWLEHALRFPQYERGRHVLMAMAAPFYLHTIRLSQT